MAPENGSNLVAELRALGERSPPDWRSRGRDPVPVPHADHTEAVAVAVAVAEAEGNDRPLSAGRSVRSR